MSNRGDRFTALVGAELKTAIAIRGFSVRAVAKATEHSPTALHGWLTGKRAIPLGVLLEVCDTIGITAREVIERAYSRLDDESVTELRPGRAVESQNHGYGQIVDFYDDAPAAALDYRDDVEQEARDQSSRPHPRQ